MNDGEIKNFKEFKDLLDEFEDDNSGREFYFRGEHNIYEYSIPSIYRDFSKGKNSKANKILRNGIASESDKFYSDLLVHLGDLKLFNLPYSNQLAEFQHYQAPTRLLDITANPLIALFFALEDTGSNDNQNRTIYFYSVDKNAIKYQDGHSVNMEVTANWMNQNIVHDFMKEMRDSTKYELIEDYEDRARDNDLYKLNDNYIYRIRYTHHERPSDNNKHDYKDRFDLNRYDPNSIDNFMKELNRKDKLPEDMTWPEKISRDLNRSYFVNFVRESSRMQRQQGAFIMPKYLTRLEDIEDIKHDKEIPQDLFTEIQSSSKNEQKERINNYFDGELYKSIILSTRPNAASDNFSDYNRYYYEENHPGFRRYTIPAESVEKMRKDISALGVNAGSVYPDIEHYSQFLIDRYNENNY